MKNRGFTLIELMVVVAIIGILASIAYPSYRSSVLKAARADGIAALTGLQLAQEKLRNNCPFYAENIGGGNVCGADASATTVFSSALSSDENYVIAITAGTGSGVAYTATATAQGTQANDSANGVSCAVLTLTVDAANPNGARTPVECW